MDSLKIPDAVKDLPAYDGNKNTLYEFIGNVDEILTIINEEVGKPQYNVIMRAIRNKIIRQANEILTMYCTPLDWKIIRETLILHYSDKRNETNLVKDLHQIRQNNDSMEIYYSRIIEIFSTIINHVRVHELNQNVINSKCGLYAEMCLNVYLSGLKEPLGSIVRAMRPKTISEAFTFSIIETNITYMRNPNYSHVNDKKPITNPRQNQTFQKFSSYTVRPNFPDNNRFPNKFQRNHYTGYNPNNTFYRNTNFTNKPTPMDTSSGNTRFNHAHNHFRPHHSNQSSNVRHNNFQNNNFVRNNNLPNNNNFRNNKFSNNNNFQSKANQNIEVEELFNVNGRTNPNIQIEEDFRERASENQSDS